jgi:hypothetical protein
MALQLQSWAHGQSECHEWNWEPKLLDRVRSAIRLRHYSPRTEEAYVGWIRRFVIFHKKRHPTEMGDAEGVQLKVGHNERVPQL